MPTFRGSTGGETLNGTDEFDTLIGFGGGGAGDILNGLGGNDFIWFQSGTETVNGGDGEDGAGYRSTLNITVSLNITGFQTVSAGHVVQFISIEKLVGGSGGDNLTGNAEDNVLNGALGNDFLTGLDGDDRLSGNRDDDTLIGGAGNDLLDPGPGNNIVDGGEGIDTLSFNELLIGSAAVSVSLSIVGVAQDTGNGMLTILGGIENLTGGFYADQLIGDDNANVISGGNENDSLSGLGGNDTLDGGSGNNTLDGGVGFDVASYQFFDRADLTIVVNGGEITIDDASSGDTFKDILTNIERVEIFDGTLAFDLDGAAGQTYRLYQASFNRAPDAAGLSHNVNLMDEGLTIFDMASAFIQSAEFQQTYGVNVDDTAFISLLYRNVLNRDPDAAGLEGWQDALNGGSSREQVLFGFSESGENKAAVAPAIDDGIWLV